MALEFSGKVPEKLKGFDPEEFREGDWVSAYFHGKWNKVQLKERPKIAGDHIEILPDEVDGYWSSVIELSVPPRKIRNVRMPYVIIGGRDYEVQQENGLSQDGEEIFSLVSVQGDQKITGLSVELLQALKNLHEQSDSIDGLKDRITQVRDIRQKELLTNFAGLKKKVHELTVMLGSPDEWGGLEKEEVSAIAEAVDRFGLEVKEEVGGFQQNVQEIHDNPVNQRQAKGRYDAAVKHEKAIGENLSNDNIVFSYVERLRSGDIFKEEVLQRRREKAEAAGIGQDYPVGNVAPEEPPEEGKKGKGSKDKKGRQKSEHKIYIEVTAGIAKDVIEEWKQEKFFDVEREKKEIQTKVTVLRKEAKSAGKDYERELNSIERSLAQLALTEEVILLLWHNVGELEVKIYRANLEKNRLDKEAKEDKKIDIPISILSNILLGRPEQLKGLMHSLHANKVFEFEGYDSKWKPKFKKIETAEALLHKELGELFKQEPDEGIQRQLYKYGIKSWSQFRRLLAGKIGIKMVGVLSQLAQDDLNRTVAAEIGPLSQMKALKGQIASRAGIMMTLVGAGTWLSSKIATSIAGVDSLDEMGEVAQLTTVGAGGAAGGAVRRLVNKIWDNKLVKNRKERLLAELEEKKRKEVIEDADKYYSEAYEDIFDSQKKENRARQITNDISAVMSQVLRDSSKIKIKEDEPEEAGQLNANSRIQYTEALKRICMESGEPTLVQKKELAIALLNMQTKAGELNVRDIKRADPLVVRALTGVIKTYTGRDDKTGVGGSALLGLSISLALSQSRTARLAVGGSMGIVGGYEMTEPARLKRMEKKGQHLIQADLDEIAKSLRERDDNPRDFFLDEEYAKETANRLRIALRGGGEGGQADYSLVPETYLYAMRSNKTLQKQAEAVLYELERMLFQIEYKRKKTEIESVAAMFKKQAKEVQKASKVTFLQQAGSWGKRNTIRLAGMITGAGAGAVTSWAAGVAFHAVKGMVVDMVSADEKPELELQHEEDQGTESEPEPEEPESRPDDEGLENPEPEPETQNEQADDEDYVSQSQGSDKSSVGTRISGGHLGAAKTALAMAKEIAEAAPPLPAEPEVQRFSPAELKTFLDERSNFSDSNKAYLLRLARDYPELSNEESIIRMASVGDRWDDGKGIDSKFPDAFNGKVSNPLEAAREADMIKFEEILKNGGPERAADYLMQRDFNAHSLHNMGIDDVQGDNDIRARLVGFAEKYQSAGFGESGDSHLQRLLGQALQHDENRDMYGYKGGALFDENHRLLIRKGIVFGMDETAEGKGNLRVHGGFERVVTPHVESSVGEQTAGEKVVTPDQVGIEANAEVEVKGDLPEGIGEKEITVKNITRIVTGGDSGRSYAVVVDDEGHEYLAELNLEGGTNGVPETVVLDSLRPLAEVVIEQPSTSGDGSGIGHGTVPETGDGTRVSGGGGGSEAQQREEPMSDKGKQQGKVGAATEKSGTSEGDSKEREEDAEGLAEQLSSEDKYSSDQIDHHNDLQEGIDDSDEWDRGERRVLNNYRQIFEWRDRVLGYQGAKFEEFVKERGICDPNNPRAKEWVDATRQALVEKTKQGVDLLEKGVATQEPFEKLRPRLNDCLFGREKQTLQKVLEEDDSTPLEDKGAFESLYVDLRLVPALEQSFQPVQEQIDMEHVRGGAANQK